MGRIRTKKAVHIQETASGIRLASGRGKIMYADYQNAREETRFLQTAKANVDWILEENALPSER